MRSCSSVLCCYGWGCFSLCNSFLIMQCWHLVQFNHCPSFHAKVMTTSWLLCSFFFFSHWCVRWYWRGSPMMEKHRLYLGYKNDFSVPLASFADDIKNNWWMTIRRTMSGHQIRTHRESQKKDFDYSFKLKAEVQNCQESLAMVFDWQMSPKGVLQRQSRVATSVIGEKHQRGLGRKAESCSVWVDSRRATKGTETALVPEGLRQGGRVRSQSKFQYCKSTRRVENVKHSEYANLARSIRKQGGI